GTLSASAGSLNHGSGQPTPFLRRRTMHLRIIASALAAASLLATSTASAAAVPTRLARGLQATGAKNAKNQGAPFAAQVAELRLVRQSLQGADHDYKGHRATAVKYVTQAIHALRPKTGRGGKGNKGAGLNGNNAAKAGRKAANGKRG